MYSAFLPICLLNDYPYSLECLACYDNYLLVGTKQGILLVYELTPKSFNCMDYFIPPNDVTRKLTSESEEIKFDGKLMSIPSFYTHVKYTRTLGKKPINQMNAIPELDLLLVLIEGRLNVYELNNCQFISAISESKGTSLFTHHILPFKFGTSLCTGN